MVNLSCNNPYEFGYYSGKTLLTTDGHLLKCPACQRNEEPIDFEKREAQTGTKMFCWTCKDCGFRTSAFIKAKCEFSLKANIIENAAKVGVERASLESYMKQFVLGNLPKKVIDEYYPGSSSSSVPLKREFQEEEESQADQPPLKKQALSDSSSDILSQILEHVKVIKEINEVQKNELKDLIVAVKTQGANALESSIKVVDLLQENTYKLNNLTPPKPEFTELTQEEQESLSSLFTANETLEHSISFIPSSQQNKLKRAKTIKPRPSISKQ